MCPKELCVQTTMTDSSYWKSIEILIKKPHVINKRLWGSKTLFRVKCCTKSSERNMLLNCGEIHNVDAIEQYRKELLHKLEIKDNCETTNTANTEIVLVELLPKAFSESHAYQLIILEQQNYSVTFFDVTPKNYNQILCPTFWYTLQLQGSQIVLQSESVTSKSFQWIKETLVPQFIKWGEENIQNQQNITESLALVCGEQYYQKYNELKQKYGKEMVKIWPECTDPAKFVYEDIAIATYLLLLWEEERNLLGLKDKQTFVDLGCGNGLLVYILAKEGHTGIGIDVRKRNIWDMYSDDVKLEERTITPSDTNLFPESDWIIGNHSDELTPWVPVIAARSSYKCNFFLLPCCAYNFDGSKYQRHNSSMSQYTEYLQYIQQLCEDCGFRTDIDRLKIPSTKRICLVGRGRTYSTDNYEDYSNRIENIINAQTNIALDKEDNSSWIKDFKPRELVEKVRNCTQIDKTLIESIVDEISNYLLEGCTLESEWSIGRTAELSEVVQLISKDKLGALKSECGGLQTLLKNNHHIFKVQSGKVQLRHPKTVEEVKNNPKSNKYKTSNLRIQEKPCWFYNKHPQGCPLQNDDCSFLHKK